MKAIRVKCLLAGLVLCLGAVGCKKNPEGVTHIPGYKPGMTGSDTPGLPFGPGSGSQEGIAATEPRTNWQPDRETFRDQTVYFEYDRANVRPSEVSKLETVASQFRSQHSGKALRIEGHCDE